MIKLKSRLPNGLGILDEFVSLANLPDSGDPWRISALVPPSLDEGFLPAIERIQEFNLKHASSENGLAVIDAIELKAPDDEHIAKASELVPETIAAFLELPYADDPQELIKSIKGAPGNLFGKIRTGGVTPDQIPTADQVARFIVRCAEQGLGFKATAGLHHPMRGAYRLTYEPEAQEGTMFGFLNVFLAACLANSGVTDQDVIAAILTESDSSAFEFEPSDIRWRQHTVSSEAIAESRSRFAFSFGSCSFDEPTSELRQLGLIRVLT